MKEVINNLRLALILYPILRILKLYRLSRISHLVSRIPYRVSHFNLSLSRITDSLESAYNSPFFNSSTA